MYWPFFLGEHICLSRWMWNLPLLTVLTTSSLHWSAVLGTQYASTVVLLCRGLPLSVVTYFLLFSFFSFFSSMSDQIQADVNRKQLTFVAFFVNDKSSYFPDSCQVNPQTVSHQSAPCHSAVGRLLPWLSCLRPDAFKELRFSSLFMMSVHVFLYWCRSREYTKGSQAALL